MTIIIHAVPNVTGTSPIHRKNIGKILRRWAIDQDQMVWSIATGNIWFIIFVH